MTTHAELHLKVLLNWAVEFVERETESLYQSYKELDGSISLQDELDAGIATDIDDAKRWLAEAREALK